MDGVWRMDVGRSKYGNPNAKPHRDQWFKFETLGDALRFSERVVYADGNRNSLGYTGRFDGAEHRITEPPSESAVVLTRERDHTLVVTLRTGGKSVPSYKMVAAPDRQTLTVHLVNYGCNLNRRLEEGSRTVRVKARTCL